MPKVASELNDRGYETSSGNKWTARTVNKMLRNPIYCGRYSVAGVDDIVAEYRIVDEALFDEVTEIRHRFRQGNRESEPPMDERRKRRYAEDVLSIYRDFLHSTGDLPPSIEST
ncbi:recombinase family protein (plasmid) [Haloarcula sp. NS06]|uniref:recombinase family protein n=1 Tax=Haloarcula sp. NS06 TaxID=3409688 RepID=UPI003DA6D4AA